MEVIKKQTGKTTELIKRSHESKSTIVCYNLEEASRIHKEATMSGHEIPMPISYHEFINNEYYGYGINGFLIDNADKLLEYLSEVQIDAITLSKDTD